MASEPYPEYWTGSLQCQSSNIHANANVTVKHGPKVDLYSTSWMNFKYFNDQVFITIYFTIMLSQVQL